MKFNAKGHEGLAVTEWRIKEPLEEARVAHGDGT